MAKLRLEVPYFQQETLYTCAAASVRMILAYYGKKKSETEVFEELGFEPEKGCHTDRIKSYLSDQGFSIESETGFETPEEVENYLRAGLKRDSPLLALVNRDVYDEKTSRTEKEVEWESPEPGYSYHFVVVTGISEKKVQLNDPHKEIGKTKLSLSKFLKALKTAPSQGWLGYIRGDSQ